MAKTLYEAVQEFLGPLVAEYGRIVEEWPPETPVSIRLAGYTHRTTLAGLKNLDRAYRDAFEAREKRDARKAKGSLL